MGGVAAGCGEGGVAGDVILVVQQMEHKRFKRHGPHLTMEKEITLR